MTGLQVLGGTALFDLSLLFSLSGAVIFYKQCLVVLGFSTLLATVFLVSFSLLKFPLPTDSSRAAPNAFSAL
jgi:hypothetical protein